MTAPGNARGGSAPGAGAGRTPAPPSEARIPFPTADEVSRHCLSDDEPESVHIEVHLPGRLDPERLRAAFRRALLAHPRVLTREVPGRRIRRSFAWELTGEPDVDPVSLAGRGAAALAGARARALDACPPLTLSPPMRLEIVEVDGASAATESSSAAGPADPTRTVLLLTTHHTALDAPSGLRVLATTAEEYAGGAALPVDGRVRPARSGPAASGTGRTVRTRPVRVAPDSRPESVRARAVGNGMLQVDLPVPPRRAAPHADLPPWTVNDRLLVAASLTVGRWNAERGRPTGPVRITMPVDDRPRGREMPMGNGTRLVEVAMTPDDPRDTDLLLGERPDPAAVARLLRTTARRTRALKASHGAPLGAGASLLTAPLLPVGVRGVLTRGARRAAAPWTSTALVTNIGRVPYALDFGDGGRATAVWFSAPARMPRGLGVAAASTGGRLHVTLRWSRALLDDEAGARLAGLFEESLAATGVEAPADRERTSGRDGTQPRGTPHTDPTPAGARSTEDNHKRPS